MRCLSCQDLSLQIICNSCQENLLKPSFNKRELDDGFFVYSFYNFDDLQELINSKYEFYGDRVFNILAKLSFKKFASTFEHPNQVYSIAIDEHTRHQFSHTSILSKSLKSQNIIPQINCLKATNIVKYAGKDLKFRKKNKRAFKYKGKNNIQIILVDDIVTTGTTILEAKEVLESHGCEVLFALTISDARI